MNRIQRTCGSILNIDSIEQHDPTRYKRILQLEKDLEKYTKIVDVEINRSVPAIIRIPVVVHVLHNGESIGVGLNISMAQIESQIDVLNEDFRRLNADAVNTPTEFQPIAADSNIEFYLACIDPQGNPTDGVVRKLGQNEYTVVWGGNEINELATGIKLGSNGSFAWPTDRYLNIWVCNLAGNLLGYAQFPFDYIEKPNTDGVVVTTTAFGRIGNIIAPFDLGRTATHEVGHWLNLRHIWGDYVGCGGVGDQVADTPDQYDRYLGYPTFPQSSCGSNDMFMNYMDYTNDACMNLFTVGQQNRMRALFAERGTRRKFVESPFGVSITGPAYFCTSAVYTLTNLPTGATVLWTAPANMSISGPNDANSVTLTKVSDGTGQLTAMITTPCGSFDVHKEIHAGVPDFPITMVDGQPSRLLTVCVGQNKIVTLKRTVDDDANTEYEWAKLYGGFNLSTYPSFPGQAEVVGVSAGEGMLQVRKKNSCGWGTAINLRVIIENCL